MKTTKPDLIDLPNMSFRLAEELAHAGIARVEALRRVGAELAWRKLRAAGFHPDFLALFALQGALEGKDWRELPRERRRELLCAVQTGG